VSDTREASARQFDRAEFETVPVALTCRGCERAISGPYFEINELTRCR